MIFAKTITVPANTPATSPLVTQLKVIIGLIYKFELMIPPGPSGLMHIWLKEGAYNLYPYNPGETFWGDNVSVSYEDLYEISDENRSLDIYAYNLDTAYDHSFQVRLGIEDKDIFIARWVPSMQVAMFETELKRIEEGKKITRQELVESMADRYGLKG